MNKSTNREELKYQALADIALAATGGIALELVAQKGLMSAIKYIDLSAGALILWDKKGKVQIETVSATRDEDKQILLETEESLLRMLRKKFKLNSAYMEMGGEPARTVFTLPIETSGRQFGALVGIKMGAIRLHEFDEFLRALAAVLTLVSMPSGEEAKIDEDEIEEKIKAERDAAVIELAVAVNHEINNPLTALLGNLQLLTLKNKNLPAEITDRLKVIEDSANQIQQVTAQLMRAAEAPSVSYSGKMKMIDLLGNNSKPDEDADEDIDEK